MAILLGSLVLIGVEPGLTGRDQHGFGLFDDLRHCGGQYHWRVDLFLFGTANAKLQSAMRF